MVQSLLERGERGDWGCYHLYNGLNITPISKKLSPKKLINLKIILSSMKSRCLVLSILSIMFFALVPSVLADPQSVLFRLIDQVIYFGSFSFLGVPNPTLLLAFTRFMIWILTFTLFFAVMSNKTEVKGFSLGFLKRNQAMVISAVIASITIIFLPVETLLAFGAGWATLIALVLVGGPVIGILAVFLMTPSDDRVYLFMKFIGCLVLLWILTAMKYHVGVVA